MSAEFPYPSGFFEDLDEDLLGHSDLNDILDWTQQNGSRLCRAVLVDSEKVHIESFDTMLGHVPRNYTVGDDPQWITERIAVLRMVALPPPPNRIEGVGMRINENTFWIIAPEDF